MQYHAFQVACLNQNAHVNKITNQISLEFVIFNAAKILRAIPIT